MSARKGVFCFGRAAALTAVVGMALTAVEPVLRPAIAVTSFFFSGAGRARLCFR